MLTLILASRKRSLLYLSVLSCTGIYLMLVFGLVFFPLSVPENWPHNLSIDETKQALQAINLVPLNNTGIFSPEPFNKHSIRDIIINLLMTVPIGFAIPYLAPMRKKFILPLATGTGLLFESIELAVKLITGTFYHTVDINDVIMNTLGFVIGYMMFAIPHQFLQNWHIRNQSKGEI